MNKWKNNELINNNFYYSVNNNFLMIKFQFFISQFFFLFDYWRRIFSLDKILKVFLANSF